MTPESDPASKAGAGWREGGEFCGKCHGFYTNLLHLAHVAEARGFALPHEIEHIARIKGWRKDHRALFHGGTPVGGGADKPVPVAA